MIWLCPAIAEEARAISIGNGFMVVVFGRLLFFLLKRNLSDLLQSKSKSKNRPLTSGVVW